MGWPVQMGYTPYAAPAIGDVDGDGDLEIVVGGLRNETVSVFNHDGTLLKGWPISIFSSTVTSVPVVGDIDDDGEIEVLVATNRGSFFGQIHAFNHDGTELDGWPLITTGNLQSSPALSDLDDDGDVELCIGSLRTRDGDEIINGSVYVWDLEGEFYPPTIEWSMFQANPAHTGIYMKNMPPPGRLAQFTGRRKSTRIRLEWTTEVEYGNLGWHIYRGESPNGPFEAISHAVRSQPAFVRGKGYSKTERHYAHVDTTPSPFKTYYYFLENRGLLDRKGRSPVIQVGALRPVILGGIKTELYQNFPNPGNPETWIPFALGKTTPVTISIYTPSGKLVRELALGRKPPGLYFTKSKAAYWDGRNRTGEQVASGIYFYQLHAGDSTATRRMLMLK